MKTQTSPNQPLRVLLVEDSENDAALLEIELQKAGYQVSTHRVETAEAMADALQAQTWDVVIADYVMPRFNGLSALAAVRDRGMDIPFIIVSGHISDDTAVAAMKAGAHDYVMKDNLARLAPAVQRELREAAERREKRRYEERLKVEHAFREAVELSVPAGIAAVDLEGRQTYVNPAFCELVGWTEADLVGKRPPFAYWPPEDIESIAETMTKAIEGKMLQGGVEMRYRHRLGERKEVLLQITPLRDAFGNISGWVAAVSDITDRKHAQVRLAAEHAITRILANANSLDEAVPGILQVLLDSLEVDIGTFWRLDDRGKFLFTTHYRARRLAGPFKAFVEANRRVEHTPGSGLPGKAWQERHAVAISEIQRETNLGLPAATQQAALQSAVAFPVQNGADFFGILEFYSTRRLDPDQTLLNMMGAIGSEIGQFIQRRSAEEALRRAHDELELRVQQRTAELKSANAKLQKAITDRQRLEQELLEITEKERRRIALDLHDDLGQKLSGIALMTKGLQLKLAKTGVPDAQDAARIHDLVQQAMSHASDLAHDLATLDVKNTNLADALRGLAAHASELFQISCQYKGKKQAPAVAADEAKQLYKIAQEAVTNAIKHGKAKRVTISLENGDGHLVLSVRNSGLPFPDLKSHASTGMGLRIMNYRANLIGASLEIKGTGTQGTLVTCTLPLETK